MTVPLALTYLLVFVAGPGLVLLLLRRPAAVGEVRLLGIVTAALVVLAIAAGMAGLAEPYGATLLLWAAWVMSMATMGQVLRLVLDLPRSGKWTALLAAIGATLPWFGLLVAQGMTG